MTKEEITEMARQAGGYSPEKYPDEWRLDVDDLSRFAKLVAEKEREECAKICDDRVTAYQYATDVWAQEHIDEAKNLAQSIRSRGQE